MILHLSIPNPSLHPTIFPLHLFLVITDEDKVLILYCEIIIQRKSCLQLLYVFSIKKKLFVGLTTLFLFIGGIYAMLTLPIDAVPDITNNQVQIVTVSPTLAPQGWNSSSLCLSK